MDSPFAFKMAEPVQVRPVAVTAAYDAKRQQATWEAGDASLFAVCTQTPSWWGQPDCSSDGIQCHFGGVSGGHILYNCDFL